MPVIRYRDYKPKAETLQVIAKANQYLASYAEQNLDLTLRQLYYQFVADDAFPDSWIDKKLHTKNTQRNYNKLGDIVAKAREGGMMDWDMIKDRTRRVSAYSHYRDPQSFLSRAYRWFNLDIWKDQPKRVEVWVEKEALAQVLESAADPYDVPTFATKGYMSSTSAWEAGHNRFLQYAQDGQEVVVIHLADHDPSGVDMSDDVLKRVDLYSSGYGDLVGAEVTVERIALNMDQVQQYDPPPSPAKVTDSRYEGYVARFGEDSWELDALDPPVIIQLIRETIETHLDQDKYEARRQLETEYRDELQRLGPNYPAVRDFLTQHLSEEDS